MSDKSTIFYRGNTAVSVDFSAEEISSDGAIVLLPKIRKIVSNTPFRVYF